MIQTKNTTAVNILRSWLSAVEVPTANSTTPGFDLSVTRRDGSTVEVMVALREDETMPGEGIQVVASKLTGRQEQPALEAFYRVLEGAGYDRVRPYNRGQVGQLNEKGNPRKLHYKDEDFLVAIRHSEFRRSPNPAKDRWARYRKIMEWQVGKFFARNSDLCQRWGMDLDDVMTYAQCYMVNFCSRYEDPKNQHKKADEHTFIEYLYQRLSMDLREILLKKERSTIPDGETVRIALFGDTDRDVEVSPNPIDTYVLVLDHPEEVARAREIVASGEQADLPEIFNRDKVDHDYIARNCELDTSSVTKRRASAAKKLAELLSQMPHDQMVEVLTNAIDSFDNDATTRKEARKQLRIHAQGCASCQALRIDEEEESAGDDAGGVEE